MKDDKKKGGHKIPKVIKNNMTDIHNVEKVTAKEKLKLRCKCQHIDESGKAVLFKSNDKKSDITGAPLFVCRLCGSYIDISELTEDELNKSIDNVCRAIDIVKMRLNSEKSEADHENYKTVWRIQYTLKSGKLTDLFKAARNRNKKNKRSNGFDGFTVGAPRSSR